MHPPPPRPGANIPRRRFVQGLAAGGAVAMLGLGPRPASAGQANIPVLTGSHFDLSIGRSPADFTGRPRMATTVNGSLPGPVLRFREGDTVTLRVRSEEHTSELQSRENLVCRLLLVKQKS